LAAGINGQIINYWNLSVEMAPGAGTGSNGVNWTNQSGYPLEVTTGDTLILNDTTTRSHLMPEHTSACLNSPTCPHNWTYDRSCWNVSQIPTTSFSLNTFVCDYTTENISFTAGAAGSYNVTLQVNNTYGGNYTSKANYITVSGAGAAPVAIFGCSPTAGVRGSIRVCNDSSTNTPTSWDYFDNPGANPCLATNLTTNNISFTSRHFGWCGPICLKASNAYGNNVNCSATNYLWSSMPWRS
jgi:PKD repeat protein